MKRKCEILLQEAHIDYIILYYIENVGVREVCIYSFPLTLQIGTQKREGEIMNSLLVMKDIMLQWGGPGGDGGGMWPGMMNWGYGAGWLMGIFNIIFWVVVIIAIVYLIKWLSASSRQGGYEKKGDSALEILRERYAKGEIDKDEFEEKKKALKG